MKVVILGATKGIGRALARRMAARGDELFLLGRDLDDLGKSAADLKARGARSEPQSALCDLSIMSGFDDAIDAAWGALGRPDCVVVTAAAFGTQDELEQDEERAAALLATNFTNTVMFCEKVRKRLLSQGGGALCVFSSVAGERGRKPVGIYGSSKAGLSHYLESLDHKFRSEGLVTTCVKPGFVRTAMTDGLSPPPFAGEPDPVAATVLSAIDAGRPVVYAPGIWRWIMLVIRLLPRAVMRRIGF